MPWRCPIPWVAIDETVSCGHMPRDNHLYGQPRPYLEKYVVMSMNWKTRRISSASKIWRGIMSRRIYDLSATSRSVRLLWLSIPIHPGLALWHIEAAKPARCDWYGDFPFSGAPPIRPRKTVPMLWVNWGLSQLDQNTLKRSPTSFNGAGCLPADGTLNPISMATDTNCSFTRYLAECWATYFPSENDECLKADEFWRKRRVSGCLGFPPLVIPQARWSVSGSSECSCQWSIQKRRQWSQKHTAAVNMAVRPLRLNLSSKNILGTRRL